MVAGGMLFTLLLIFTNESSENTIDDNSEQSSKEISAQLDNKVAAYSRSLFNLSNSSYWQDASTSDWSQRVDSHSGIYQTAGISFLGVHALNSKSVYIESKAHQVNEVGIKQYLSQVYNSQRPLRVLANYKGTVSFLFLQPIRTIENEIIGSLIAIKLIDSQLLKDFHYATKQPAVLLQNKRIVFSSVDTKPEISAYTLQEINWPDGIKTDRWELALLAKRSGISTSRWLLLSVGIFLTLTTTIYVWLQIVKIRSSLRLLNKTLDLDLPIAEQIKHLSGLQNHNLDLDLLECSQGIRGRLEQLSQQKKALSIEIRKLQDSENKLRLDKSNMSEELSSAVAAPRLKSEFLSRMGDEVTTPMKSVVSMLKLLSEYPFDAEPKQLLNIAKRSTRLLVNNLNNIMDFSKLDAEMLKLKPKSFSVRELVDDLSSELSHFATEKSLSLQASCSSELPTSITADDYRIKQILRNLLSNALRFTKEGEVSLFADITAKAGSKLVRFTIADTGIGISPAAQKGLFDSLEQSTKLTNSSFAGRLRLIVSKMLAEQMGGEIGVESEIGKGSQFWFTVAYEE